MLQLPANSSIRTFKSHPFVYDYIIICIYLVHPPARRDPNTIMKDPMKPLIAPTPTASPNVPDNMDDKKAPPTAPLMYNTCMEQSNMKEELTMV